MSSDQLTDALQGFLRGAESGRLAHAYLVVGNPETGGRPFAERALQELFCSSDEKACGVCAGCRQVAEWRHPDILWVEPESRGRVIRIEQIRALNRQIAQSSYAGGWKAGVVAWADRLNQESANAFLKTLEEPAGRTILLLLTEAPQALLPTIVSRCQRIVLAPEEGVVEGRWKGEVVALLAQGRPADELEGMRWGAELEGILDRERELIREETAEEKSDEPSEIRDARVEARLRGVRSGILRFLTEWQRDVLLMVLGASEEVLLNPDLAGEIREVAKDLDYRTALARLRAMESMVRRIDRNLPSAAVFEQAFLAQ